MSIGSLVQHPAFIGGGAPGIPELMIILFVVMLLFGGKKLPGLARSLGRSLSEFKRGKHEGEIAASSVGKDDAPSSDAAESTEDKNS